MFNFRLQRVLDLRAKREQEAATRVAEAQKQVEAAVRACEALEAVRRDGQDRLAGAHRLDPTVGQLQNLNFVIEQLSQHVAGAREGVRAAEENAQQVVAAFAAAVQERRVLDRLRERHLDRWRNSEVQADRAAMDSIALTRFARRDASRPAQES